MSMNPNQAPRSGLLGLLDRVRRPDEETGLNFANRLGMAASVLNPMNPQSADYRQQMMQSGQARMKGQARNRTIGELEKRAAAGDKVAQRYLEAVQSRALDASQGFAGYLAEMQANERLRQTEAAANARAMLAAGTSKPPSKVQAYEYAVNQLGMTQEEALKFANSGQTTIISDKGVDEFAKLDAKTLSEAFSVGANAQRNMANINRLEQLLGETETGSMAALKFAAGNFGIETEGLDDLQAAAALINSLVPQQRPAGSGPMSDADLALFKQSLPRLINQPRGNEIILQTLRGIAQYDALGAQIVQKYRSGEIDKNEAFQQLLNRPDPFASQANPSDYLP